MNILRQKEVKTRKEHNCFGCTKVLPKGSVVLNLAEEDGGGGVNCSWWCSVCVSWTIENADLMEDGMEYGALMPEGDLF